MMSKIKPSILSSANLAKLKKYPEKVKESKALATTKVVQNVEQKSLSVTQANKRLIYEKLALNSYLQVCVDVGQIHRASNLLVKFSSARLKPVVDVKHYNIVLKGWAKLSSLTQIKETRINMIRNLIAPNAETFAYLLLGHTKNTFNQEPSVRILVSEMKRCNIDPRELFQSTYLGQNERKAIQNLLKIVDPAYEDLFWSEDTNYDCELLDGLARVVPKAYDFAGDVDMSRMKSWADHQRSVEAKSSVTIKSVAFVQDPSGLSDRYLKAWQKYNEFWRNALTKALDESLASISKQCSKKDSTNLYPYLCAVDKGLIVNLLLDEIETAATCTNYSFSSTTLHAAIGRKFMIRYLRSKSVIDGSLKETQQIYNSYLDEYCRNPVLMGKLNSREYIQKKALETKNYSIYKNRTLPVENWPFNITLAIGKFFYGLLLKEVKFDPDVIKNPRKEIKQSNLVHAFYTAYFQIECSHKIKEEFRAHHVLENFHMKGCASRLRFDYTHLPTSTPPLPWVSPNFGGFLTNKVSLVRSSLLIEDELEKFTQPVDTKQFYPSLDGLNAISFCPWCVNKEVLDIVIKLFRDGGDQNLKIPLSNELMEQSAPALKDNPTKVDKIMFNKEQLKFLQKKKEMYSMWRECLYRLSIANHFRDRIFWFPHNMDFRGRTYPVPPHFNHLGSDLVRSLLLFAKGQPLGEDGLDWLKIHLINLTGKMKKHSLKDRLKYANSILHNEILDSADNPWDGRRWWCDNENPWQTLACCKEIAKAIRSQDHTKYVSHFPVHQDGSCNGLQHYAALGRDFDGATAVNLIPHKTPQDVYSRVVDIVEKMRQEDAKQGVQIAIRLKGFVQRKVIKQTVMTTVYGVTYYGAKQQIAKQLHNKGFSEKDLWVASSYLSKKTLASIGNLFHNSRLIQDWFNQCADIIVNDFKQPIRWTTALGFHVLQPYFYSAHSNSKHMILKNSRIRYFASIPKVRINGSKQKAAFPPNYIHSLDSSHMILTSLYCQKDGVTFASVHDCYWTHPSTVNIMNRICREQFVALHSQPLLKNLSDQFVKNYYDMEADAMAQQTAVVQAKKTSQNAIDSDEFFDEFVKHDMGSIIDKDNYDDDNLDTEIIELKPERSKKKTLEPAASKQPNSCRYWLKIFKSPPEPGKLNLTSVIKSTYFFS